MKLDLWFSADSYNIVGLFVSEYMYGSYQ